MKMKLFLLVVITVLTNYSLSAQIRSALIDEYEKIYKAYLEESRLSFDIKYLYLRQSNPAIVDDSSVVSFKMDGKRFMGVTANMEFMQNDSFALVVYPSERLFTLGKPDRGFGRALPIAQWDSLLATDDLIYSMENENDNKKITIEYKNGSQTPIRKLEIWYDPVSYFMQRVSYVIRETPSQVGDEPRDAIVVTMRFTNYQSGKFNDAVFNSGKYFTKAGDQYIPVNNYKGFEVFIVSPGL